MATSDDGEPRLPFCLDRTEPTLYVIVDARTTIISTDYHVAKGVGRTLAYITDRPVLIRCGEREVTAVNPSDCPLAKLFEHADS